MRNDSNTDIKWDFIDKTGVYVSDRYYYDELHDDIADNYNRLDRFCDDWFDLMIESDSLDLICALKNNEANEQQMYVVLEDAVNQGWLEPEAIYDDSQRGYATIFDILCSIEVERDEYASKYYDLSEKVAEAVKYTEREVLINNDISVALQ